MPIKNTTSAIDMLLNEIAKSAEARTETGGYQGSTTHPVKAVDDGTHPATEGSRSSENTADVKKDYGELSVDSSPEKKPSTGTMGDANAVNIGVQQAATGEDSASEDDYEGGGHSDGSIGGESSHPARTDNSSLDGNKYASVNSTELRKAAEALTKTANAILASFVAGDESAPATPKAAGAPAPATTTPAADTSKTAAAPPAPPSEDAAVQAGYDLATMFGPGMDKQALDQVVLEGLREVWDLGQRLGEKAAQVVQSFHKKSEEDKEESGSSESGGSSEPTSSAGPPSSPPGETPSPAGGPPAGGGGAPSGGEGGDVIQMLLDALAQAGISPEQFMSALSGGAGGDGGAGAPPVDPGMGAGGPPPSPPPGAGAGGDPMAAMMGGKVANDLAPPRAPAPPKPERVQPARVSKVAEMRAFLSELSSRSRR